MGPGKINQLPTRSATSEVRSDGRDYPVQKNDTLYGIAKQVTQELGLPCSRANIKSVLLEIFRLNERFDPTKADGRVDASVWNAKGQDPDYIRVGEQIVVPTVDPTKSKARVETKDVVDATVDPDMIEDDLTQTATKKVNKTDPNVALDPKNTENTKTTENTDNTDNTDNTTVDQVSTDATENEVDEENLETKKEEGKEEKEGAKLSKNLGNILKLFKTPMFQGLMALLNLIPGISAIVSAVGAILSITDIVRSWIDGKPPGPLELGMALGYVAGIFMPGLGSMGGLMGMLAALKEMGVQPQPTSDKQPIKEEEEVEETIEPMPEAEIATMLAAVEDFDGLDDPQLFAEWEDKVDQLEQQYLLQLLNREVEVEGTALHRFMSVELPQAISERIASVGLGLSELAPTSTPELGRLFEVSESVTIGELAQQIPDVDQATLTTLIAAYSGYGVDESLKAGTLLYIPSAEALEAGADQMPRMAEEDLGSLKLHAEQLLQWIYDVQAGQDRAGLTRSQDVEHARQLGEVFVRLEASVEPTDADNDHTKEAATKR